MEKCRWSFGRFHYLEIIPLNHYQAIFFFVLKMSSAYYVCCIHSSAHQTRFFMKANAMNPDQTVPKEKFDLGPKITCL